MDREAARMGTLITLEEPTKGMVTEAKAAGIFTHPFIAALGRDSFGLAIFDAYNTSSGMEKTSLPSVCELGRHCVFCSGTVLVPSVS